MQQSQQSVYELPASGGEGASSLSIYLPDSVRWRGWGSWLVGVTVTVTVTVTVAVPVWMIIWGSNGGVCRYCSDNSVQ